jgi:hypothetical protein
MTTTLQQLTASQANKEVAVNRNFETLSPMGMYGLKQSTTTGLTLGYYGGHIAGSAVADGTIALDASNTVYVVAHRTTGVVSKATNTTNWDATSTYGRLFKCTTSASAITPVDWREQDGGWFDRTAVAGSGDVATDTIWDAAGDLVQATGSNTAARLPIGTALQVLRVNAGATAVEWAAAGNVATDAVWDAAGDLVQGTGANTAARLALGTAGQVLKVNAGATAVEWGAGAGDVATDAIWDAAGDLAVGSGANTAAKLSKGTALQVLRVNAGATTLEWADPSAGGSGTKTYAVFTPMTSQPPASNFATLDTRNSIAVLDFDDSTEESIFWAGVMPEAASLGSGLIVNIFFMATSATSGDARFGAQFERMNTDQDSDSFDTATEATVATSGTSGIVTKLAITCTTIDSLAAGEAYRLKIYRDTSGADTITGDVEVVAVELRSAA